MRDLRLLVILFQRDRDPGHIEYVFALIPKSCYLLCGSVVIVVVVVVVVVLLFPTEYKQWRTEYMSNITTTMHIDDPVGGHQRRQRLIWLATKSKLRFKERLDVWFRLGVIVISLGMRGMVVPSCTWLCLTWSCRVCCWCLAVHFLIPVGLL